MAFILVSIVQAIVGTGRVHPFSTSFTATAPGMYLGCYPVTDLKIIDSLAQLYHRSHIFVPRSEVFVKRHSTLYYGWQSIGENFQIGATNGNGINAHQDLWGTRLRNRLLSQSQLLRVIKNPGFHHVGHFQGSTVAKF